MIDKPCPECDAEGPHEIVAAYTEYVFAECEECGALFRVESSA